MGLSARALAALRRAEERFMDTFLCAITYTGQDTSGNPGMPCSSLYAKAQFFQAKRDPQVGAMADDAGHALSRWKAATIWDTALGRPSLILNATSSASKNSVAAWSGATTYAIGDIVFYLNRFYIAAVASTNVAPTSDATKWTLLERFQYQKDDRSASDRSCLLIDLTLLN